MDKHKSTNGTRTLTIGELAVKIKSSDLSATLIDTAFAADFEVEVEYSYKPGHPGKLDGHWDTAEEPCPAEIDVKSIKSSSNLHFTGDDCEVIITRGTDLKPLFTSREITALEDRLIFEIEREAQ